MKGRVTVLYPITDLTVGGTQQQLLELVKGLDKRRFTPVVVTLISGGPLEPEFRKVPGCRLLQLGRKGRLDFSGIWKIGHVLRKLRVDIVQPFLTPATLFSLIPALVCRTPVRIVTERAGPPRQKGTIGHRAYLKTEDLLTRFTDWAIPNSSAGRNYLVQRGIQKAKIKVIYNGIDLARLTSQEAAVREVRGKLSVSPEGKVVGMLARLFPEKGHAVFLQSAAMVSRAVPGTRFAMVGGGPLRNELEQLTERLGLTKEVFFLGERRDVGNCLAAFDVAVLPSEAEGCSNVILEAMAVGKPVVCTDAGGNSELVRQGETGILVPQADPETLALAVISLLRDPAAIRTMGDNAKKMIANWFSVQGMVRQYQDLYNETLERKQSPKIATRCKSTAREILLLCASRQMTQRSRDRLLRLFQGPIDWEHLLSLAEFHGLTPLLYNNLASSGFAPLIPSRYWEILMREYNETLYRNTVLSAETREVLSLLGKNRIDTIPFKGPVLAETLYGNLAVRPTSDIDILVQSPDAERARACLAEANCTPLYTQQKSSNGYDLQGMSCFQTATLGLPLELHWSLGDSRVVSFDESTLWQRARQGGKSGCSTFSLSPEDSLIFLSYHLTRHNTHLLKYLCDIAELLKRYSGKLDWDYLHNRARACGVETVLYYSLKRARDLLDVPVPGSQLEALRPGPLRRWLLDRLMPVGMFIVPNKRKRLRSETIALAHSLMMKKPRQIVLALFLGRRAERSSFAGTFAWALVVLSVAIVSRALKIEARPSWQ